MKSSFALDIVREECSDGTDTLCVDIVTEKIRSMKLVDYYTMIDQLYQEITKISRNKDWAKILEGSFS